MGLFKKSSLPDGDKKKKETKMDPFVEEKIKAGVPIDHGWAWMCVLACNLMNMLMSGLIRSQGIFYLELVDLFESTSLETMWVFSISGFCISCIAPFSNSFAARFSSRHVVFTGAILVAFGFIVSNFTTSLKVMYLTYGIFVGIGFGLVYAPAITTVGYYFHRRRALANGLSVAGSSIGSFFMPQLISFLIDKYSIKGAFIIIGGLMLHMCITAALLRPMEFYVERQKRLNLIRQTATASTNIEAQATEEKEAISGLSQDQRVGSNISSANGAGDKNEESSTFHEQVYGRFRVLPALPASVLNTVHESNQEEEEARMQSMLLTSSPTAPSTPLLGRSTDNKKLLSKFSATGLVPRSHCGSQRWQSMNSIHSSSTGIASEALQAQNPQRTRSCVSVLMSVPGCPRDNSELPALTEAGLERRVSDSDIGSAQTTLTHGGRTLPIFSESALQAVRKELVRLEQNKVLKRSRPTSHSFRQLLMPRVMRTRVMFSLPSNSIVASVPDLAFASLQNLPQRWSIADEPTKSRGWRANIREFCKLRQKVTMQGKVRRGKGVPIIDPWVLRQPSFYLLTIGMAMCITIFSANFMMVPSYAEGLGVPKAEVAVFLQYMGITDLCGRLLSGWLADLNIVPRKYLLIGFFLGEGLICLFLPTVFSSPTGLVVFSLLLGLFAGSIIPLTAVVICDALGIRRLSSSFGMSMLFFGIASASIPSFLSALRDYTGSWVCAYYFCGSLCMIAALLVVIDAAISKRWPVTDDDSETSKSNADEDVEKATSDKLLQRPEIIVSAVADDENGNMI